MSRRRTPYLRCAFSAADTCACIVKRCDPHVASAVRRLLSLRHLRFLCFPYWHPLDMSNPSMPPPHAYSNDQFSEPRSRCVRPGHAAADPFSPPTLAHFRKRTSELRLPRASCIGGSWSGLRALPCATWRVAFSKYGYQCRRWEFPLACLRSSNWPAEHRSEFLAFDVVLRGVCLCGSTPSLSPFQWRHLELIILYVMLLNRTQLSLT